MRRKPGAVTVFEQRVLDALGEEELHGVELARRLEISNRNNYGSLYRALKNLQRADLARVASRLESARVAEREGRPRRRYYRRTEQQP